MVRKKKTKQLRCLCYTAKRSRCKRHAMKASDYCWQHQACVAPYLSGPTAFACTNINPLRKFVHNTMALVHIYVACRIFNVPLLAGARAWHDIVRTSKNVFKDIRNKRISAPKKSVLFVNKMIQIYGKKYSIGRYNFIAHWYFDQSCNCVCATSLLLAVARVIGLSRPIAVLSKTHIYPVIRERNAKGRTILSKISISRDGGAKLVDFRKHKISPSVLGIVRDPQLQAMVVFFSSISRPAADVRLLYQVTARSRSNIDAFLAIFPHKGQKFVPYWKNIHSLKNLKQFHMDELTVLYTLTSCLIRVARLVKKNPTEVRRILAIRTKVVKELRSKF